MIQVTYFISPTHFPLEKYPLIGAIKRRRASPKNEILEDKREKRKFVR